MANATHTNVQLYLYTTDDQFKCVTFCNLQRYNNDRTDHEELRKAETWVLSASVIRHIVEENPGLERDSAQVSGFEKSGSGEVLAG